jgi:hypothetical protein
LQPIYLPVPANTCLCQPCQLNSYCGLSCGTALVSEPPPLQLNMFGCSLRSTLDLCVLSVAVLLVLFQLFGLQNLNPEVVVRPLDQLKTCGACWPSWGRPHRPCHVQVGLTIALVFAAGNEVMRQPRFHDSSIGLSSLSPVSEGFVGDPCFQFRQPCGTYCILAVTGLC